MKMSSPTLHQLLPTSPEEFAAVEYYLDYCKKYGHYYLGGQVKLFSETSITPTHISTVKIMNDPSKIDYCNSLERESIYASIKQFSHIVDMVNRYNSG
jgi:hypothetical protein